MTGHEAAIAPFTADDDLLAGTRADGRARLRVRPWQDTTVVIGRGGKPELELDLAAISADGVDLLRRPGGGCAVVLDPGNVVASVVLPLPGLSGIKSAFAAISKWLIANLAAAGLAGLSQEGVSDLVLDGRKIGGSCVYRTRGLLYYSTTLLVDPDLDLVERYLPHPPREPGYRRGRPHREFMGRLADFPACGTPDKLAGTMAEFLAKPPGPLSDSLILI